MNKRNIGYWAATGMVAFVFSAGGLADLSGAPAVVEAMSHLGYPAYVASLLGAWKVLGAVAVVAPRFPRLKEWAYAGMIFDLTGAAVSHASSGDPLAKVLIPLVIAGLVVTSWALRPASRVLSNANAVTTRTIPVPRTAEADTRLAA